MAFSFNTPSPLTYRQWLDYQDQRPKGTDFEYISYLKTWYKRKSQNKNLLNNIEREEYVQLLKDLNFAFKNDLEEEDLFLKDIDYNKEEDLILTIPFFAKKLREIAQVINHKRESLKNTKSKYALVGSTQGLEDLMYNYMLKSFTKRNDNLTIVPLAKFHTVFPTLSSVNQNFYIEVEELYDFENYLGSDPTIDVSEYLNIENITDLFPFDVVSGVSENQLLSILATRFLPRTADSVLLKIFENYISILPDKSDSETDISYRYQNLKEATKKYSSQTLYGLTAIKLEEVNTPDQILNIDLAQGQNWFLWPSGYQVLNNLTYNNFFEPINIQNSSFINSGATAGSNLKDSDLIFSDKNGILEGAWLRGPYSYQSKDYLKATLKAGDITEFLYPYVGYKVSSNNIDLEDFSIQTQDSKIFDALDISQQTNILKKYYTNSFPSSASNPVYLNQTTLIQNGAYAGDFSNESDVIIIQKHNFTAPEKYTGETSQAYAYKFKKTDLPVTAGYTFINWPTSTYTEDTAVPISFTEKDCLPVKLKEINPQFTMAGAVASTDKASADIIYKLNYRTTISNAKEAAWLASVPVSFLDRYVENKYVYGKPGSDEFLPVENCSHALEGAIQGSMAFKVAAGENVSFVWCGPDTYADEVFKYYPHASDCPYGNEYPHDYYLDQDYLNPNPLNNKLFWQKCNCHSIHYSPIGHKGTKAFDYDALTDLLYEDPFGLGDSFNIGSWKDTRNLNATNSPQFAFFQLDKTSKLTDENIGYGEGRWVTSGPRIGSEDSQRHRMVFKTGRRYSYRRTSLRKDPANNNNIIQSNLPPYLVVNYIYPTINAQMGDINTPCDFIFLWDISKSQSFNFEETKQGLIKLCKTLLLNDGSVQVAVVAFASNQIIASYLTTEFYELQLMLNSITQPLVYNDYQTDLGSALQIGQYILTTKIVGLDRNASNLKTLCSNLKTTIANLSKLTTTVNVPQSSGVKRIVVISDGIQNLSTQKNKDLYFAENSQTIKEIAKDIKNGIVRVRKPLDKLNYNTNYNTLKTTPLEIVSIVQGEMGILDKLQANVMEHIASDHTLYFDLYKYLTSGDGTYETFIDYISRRLVNIKPFRPVWRKLTRELGQDWVDAGDDTDIILNPNDYLCYFHQSQIVYRDLFKDVEFYQPSISFSINIKLDGWDYTTNSFHPSNVGPEFGAKPFWAEIPNEPVSFAGNISFYYDYVPVHQPKISTAVLNSGSFIQYKRVSREVLQWDQPLTFTVSVDSTYWAKINFKKEIFNLQEILRVGNNLNYLIEPSPEPSNLLLESFSQYKPSRYYYIAKNLFAYSEKLYLKNRCGESYVVFQSGAIVKPEEPYNNILNEFYPSIATISLPGYLYSEKQIGGYLLPHNMGVSSYRGRGYTYSITPNSVSASNLVNYEGVFLDNAKYGKRNRGLTKKDQLMPFELTDLDNSWIYEPFISGLKAGVAIDPQNKQKLTPYQSSYEIVGYNMYGLSRQDDEFEFWNFDNDQIKWNQRDGSRNYRGDFTGSTYQTLIDKLLINKGELVQWRSDIFGSDFGLYKNV